MTKRDVAGYAIGGLSGGEEKAQFWRMVDISTDFLPREKPRYLMGVGYVVSHCLQIIAAMLYFDLIKINKVTLLEGSCLAMWYRTYDL